MRSNDNGSPNTNGKWDLKGQRRDCGKNKILNSIKWSAAERARLKLGGDFKGGRGDGGENLISQWFAGSEARLLIKGEFWKITRKKPSCC